MQNVSTENNLSIVVPVLNESEQAPLLIENLSCQKNVHFELIFCDGGSTDQTVENILGCAAEQAFAVQVVKSEPGRAKQLNSGFRHARYEWLLFLHVDSRFEDDHALMLSLAMMQREMNMNDIPPAGHFPLNFQTSSGESSFAYYFYEAKTRTGLPDSVHGDQGLFIHRETFSMLGHYNEALPFLEDSFLADAVFDNGRWVLLPVELSTSARRFETEGLFQRQVLSALIMNFRHLQWHRFFNDLPDIYRQQKKCERLDLLLFWRMIRKLLSRENPVARIGLWYGTGDYVRSQAWQIYFLFHCLKRFKRGQCVVLDGIAIRKKMAGFHRITDNPAGKFVTSVGVYIWFNLFHLYLWSSRNKTI